MLQFSNFKKFSTSIFVFLASFLVLAFFVNAQSQYHLPNPLYLTLRNVTANQEYGNTGQGVRAALNASSTDTLLFKWAKVDGAQAYWYSSDLTRNSSGAYEWRRLDTNQAQDRGIYYTLEMPASTIPEGVHWFQLTACSQNAQDCSQSASGYPYLYVWVRMGGIKFSSARTTISFFGQRQQQTFFSNFAFNQSERSFDINQNLLLFIFQASSTENNILLDRLDLEVQGGIDARTAAWTLHIEEENLQPTHIFSDRLVFEDINKVIQDGRFYYVSLSLRNVPSSWRNKFVRFVINDAKGIRFNHEVNLLSIQFPYRSESFLFSGVENYTNSTINVTWEKDDVSEVIDNFIFSSLEPELFVENLLHLIGPKFDLITSAALHSNIPLKSVIRVYERAGYLRQAVRSALRAGADSSIVIRALHDAGVSMDSVRQLYNEFSVVPGKYLELVRTAGYSITNLSELSLRPEGIHISGFPRVYSKILLKGIYVVPEGLDPSQDWQGQLGNILDRVSRFYKSELRGAVTVDRLMYPRFLRGGAHISNLLTNESGLELDRVLDRVFTDSSSDYIDDFARQENETFDIVVIFIENSHGQQGSIAGFGASQIYRFASAGILPDQPRGIAVMNFNIPFFGRDGMDYLAAHEVGHALSFPHSWNVVENIYQLTGFFQDILGNVMGYSTSRATDFPLLKNGFITDNIINLVLVGERSSLHASPHLGDVSPFTGNISSASEIRESISLMRTKGVEDTLIIENLLNGKVSPALVIISYQSIEGGLPQLIRSLERAGVAVIEIVRAFKGAGFIRNQIEVDSMRAAFNNQQEFSQALDEVFGPYTTSPLIFPVSY